jgi:hypothetical protein
MSRRPLILLLAFLGGCYDRPFSENFGATTPNVERSTNANTTVGETLTPVRIGESGPSFAACNSQGRIRDRVTEGSAVRVAPFERARQTGMLMPGATFFICSRSIDQHWFGIVYETPGNAGAGCGVSTPTSRRRDYEGPCESGWVASAQVQLISGIERAPDQSNGNSAKSN